MLVLFSAVPSVGHNVPMLDLARAVQGASHEVLFATGADRHRFISGAGLRAVAAGMSAPEMVAERRRRWPMITALVGI